MGAKKVEFKFDERSLATEEEVIREGRTLVVFDEDQMKIVQSYRLNEAQMKGEINRLRAALAKSDPIHRVYDGSLPVLECIHCGGRRGRFENEVQHSASCIWEKAKEQHRRQE